MKSKIGSIIRINRISQNMSLRALANVVGIEYSQLSKIERGIESSNEFVLEMIFQSLDLEYTGLDEFIHQNQEYFNHLLRNVLYRKNSIDTYNSLEKYNDFVSGKYITIENILANIMYLLTWQPDKEKIQFYFALLDQVESSLSNELKQLYFLYRGYYLFVYGKVQPAIDYFNLAKTNQYNKHITALVHYYHGMALGRIGQYFESYIFINEAKMLFSKYNNYLRNAICLSSIANLYLLTERYDEALDQYNQTLEIFETFNIDNSCYHIVYENILLTCILNKEFHAFFEYLSRFTNEVLEIMKHDPKFIFYNIVALYETKEYDQCLEKINEFNSININKIDKHVVNYFEYKIKQRPHEKIVKTLERNFNQLEKIKDRNYTRLVLNLLLKEYEEIGNYEKLYYYAKQLAKLKV